MTYTLARTSDTEYELRDDAGNVITTLSPPVTVPNDIIDAIINEEIPGASESPDQPATKGAVKSALKVLISRDWEVIDER